MDQVTAPHPQRVVEIQSYGGLVPAARDSGSYLPAHGTARPIIRQGFGLGYTRFVGYRPGPAPADNAGMTQRIIRAGEGEVSPILQGRVWYHAAGEELVATVGDLVLKPRGE